MPSAHGVPLGWVVRASRSSASAARRVSPVRAAASISSARAQVAKPSSCGYALAWSAAASASA